MFRVEDCLQQFLTSAINYNQEVGKDFLNQITPGNFQNIKCISISERGLKEILNPSKETFLYIIYCLRSDYSFFARFWHEIQMIMTSDQEL